MLEHSRVSLRSLAPLLAASLLVWLYGVLASGNSIMAQSGPTRASLDVFSADLLAGSYSSVVIEPDRITATSASNRATVEIDLPQGMGTNWNFVQWVLENRGRASVSCSTPSNLLTQILVPLIPWVLIFGFVWFVLFRQLRRNNASQRPVPVVIANPAERT